MLKKAVLWEKVESGKVRCGLCAHRCVIGQGKFGLCGMRENSGGELYTHAYGKVIAARPDPVEKKPFYHFLPGTEVYSVAAIGCNLRCAFCQNWTISFLSAEEKSHAGTMASPEKIVEEAEKASCAGISYTYTEPTVFFEFAYETAKIAKQRGLSNSFVTNGFMTEEAIEIISPYLDAANVDLKFFRDASYREICKGRLDPVLRSIRSLKKRGVWVEVTTLLIPGKNDSEEEIGDIASFLSETGSDIPWHISRFRPDNLYGDIPSTPDSTLSLAAEIGRKKGLKYIYTGNADILTDTRCPECGASLIEREGFCSRVMPDLRENGVCGVCGTVISGIWTKK